MILPSDFAVGKEGRDRGDGARYDGSESDRYIKNKSDEGVDDEINKGVK